MRWLLAARAAGALLQAVAYLDAMRAFEAERPDPMQTASALLRAVALADAEAELLVLAVVWQARGGGRAREDGEQL
ncbi:MAG: hypothetical protein FJ035_01880 [Chloroflexi bacterium]|nr:hypothetical protein [Chloroflexota bacterium]